MTKRYQHGDRNLTVAQWFREPEVVALDISIETFSSRLARHGSIERAISEPVDASRRTYSSTGRERGVPHRKTQCYWSAETHDAVIAEAERIGRPVSWVVQWCVRKVLPKMKGYPSPDEIRLVPSPVSEEPKR